MYLYDDKNHELAKFKDITYAYRGAFIPRSNIFVLRSTEGRMAVYDCDERRLLFKFRFSDVGYSQDDGFCFSPDGKYFLNNSWQKLTLLLWYENALLLFLACK